MIYQNGTAFIQVSVKMIHMEASFLFRMIGLQLMTIAIQMNLEIDRNVQVCAAPQ